jgi:hypothetical protein
MSTSSATGGAVFLVVFFMVRGGSWEKVRERTDALKFKSVDKMRKLRTRTTYTAKLICNRQLTKEIRT